MNTKEFFESGDTNNDGAADCYKYTIHLPKKLTDGSLIPATDMWCIVYGYSIPYYEFVPWPNQLQVNSPPIALKFNGSTWALSNTLQDGSSYTIPQDVSVSALSTVENLKSKILIFPNPTNNFITIQNNENTIENFRFKIVDLTGRIVKSGDSKFNEQINVENLTKGNYIFQFETNNQQKLSEKLIKN